MIADTRSDQIRALTTGFINEFNPIVSPDGKKIIYSTINDQYDLIQIPLDQSPIKSITSTGWNEKGPAWSPNGKQFAYVSDRSGSEVIWIKSPLDGSEKPFVTEKDFADRQTSLSRPSFSPDGQRLAYHRGGEKRFQIWISNLAGGSP